MASYCTADDVSNELNGYVIDGSSTPSQTTVEEWITQESDLLAHTTKIYWSSELITSEYLDYDGSGFIRLKNAPIISISLFEHETNGLAASTENWVSLTEGRTNDYITFNKEGEIQFIGNNQPSYGIQSIRTTYNAGVTPTPTFVTKYIAKKVAQNVIGAVLNSSGTKQGGSITVGAISIADPTTFSIDNVNRLGSEIEELNKQIGKFKVYRYTRVW